ncbi:hypothetical protein BD626DRAFT_536059 [Schizophyllum amplum]|uniref:HMG box domain-containing protein n=1 Tax=Schizophyllum amplum TaxID=97359 RepID=A0A550CJ55_9AGAR|nr:hypothetical protein BD626DRAFT_536059 [Auriculariopsis ampla]
MTFFRTVRLVVDDAEYDFPLPEIGSSEVPRPKKDGKIPRPPNQWIVWRAAFMKACLSYGKMLPGGLCTHAHLIWEGLSPEEKKPWADEAKRIAEEHKRLYPDYKFHPVHDPAKRKSRAQKKSAAVQRSTSPEDEGAPTPAPNTPYAPNNTLSSPPHYTWAADDSHVTSGPGSLSPASIHAGRPAIMLPHLERTRTERALRAMEDVDHPHAVRAMPSLVLSARWYDTQGTICPPALRLDPRDTRHTHRVLPSMALTPPVCPPTPRSVSDNDLAPIAKVRRTGTAFEDSRRAAAHNTWPASVAQWPTARQSHDTPVVAVAKGSDGYPLQVSTCGKKRARCASGTSQSNFRAFRRASLCEK